MEKTKYQLTAKRMDDALLSLLEKKDYEYISIKEVCHIANVNRSTFYLHYENMDDLLSECVNDIYSSFFDTFQTQSKVKLDFQAVEKEKLNFITPDYLLPFLSFVKENQRVLRIVFIRPNLMKIEIPMKRIFSECMDPILGIFSTDKFANEMIKSFYLSGIGSIVNVWVKQDCKMPIEEVMNLIINLIDVPHHLKKHES